MAKKSSKQSLYSLPSWLNVETAEALLAFSKDCLEKKNTVEINGGQVSRVGMPGVQALLAIKKSCLQQSVPFELKSPSKVLLDAFEDLGCSSYLS